MPWPHVVAVIALAGFVFVFAPLMLEFVLLKRFARYVNMDGLQLQRLLHARSAGELAMQLSQKLSEKGILLSWKTQRRLAACQEADRPLSIEAYDALVQSLEEYRTKAGILAGRVGVLAWNAGDELDYAPTGFAHTVFAGIRRDWREFGLHCAFLRSFLKNNTTIVIGKI
jgi:hypothetical protein